jgi:putative ABC transport system substrate-binding protein
MLKMSRFLFLLLPNFCPVILKSAIRNSQSAILVCALLLALCFFAEAQQSPKTPRIGVLSAGTPSSNATRVEALRQGLREAGYIEGKNITIEHRYAGETLDRLPSLANELVRLEVDLIVAAGNQAITAAKQSTATIPIVMATSGDAVRQGFVASLARPGGNVTGLTLQSPELSGKRLELLIEVVPRLSLVALLLKSGNPLHAFTWKETEAAAQALKVKLQPVEVRESEEFESAFATMARSRAGALIVPLEPMFNNQIGRIVNLAAKNRLPGMYGDSQYVDAGGVMAYGASIANTWRHAATYVDKILKGAKPAELPVEQPTKFELVINLKTAQQIGLTIPPQVLARADKVIK